MMYAYIFTNFNFKVESLKKCYATVTLYTLLNKRYLYFILWFMLRVYLKDDLCLTLPFEMHEDLTVL